MSRHIAAGGVEGGDQLRHGVGEGVDFVVVQPQLVQRQKVRHLFQGAGFTGWGWGWG